MAGTLAARQGLLAAVLTATAGFVDGMAFIHLGGHFVSFMSGNSTRAGADLAEGDSVGWAKAMELVAFFVAGVVAASLAVHMRSVRSRHQEPAGPQSAAVWVSMAFLLLAGLMSLVPALRPAVPPAVAAGRGAVNGTFTRGGAVTVGLTYMTGTLVKTGQHLALALTGGNRVIWLRFLALWAAIALGSAIGALAYLTWGLGALWVAVVLLAGIAAMLDLRHRRGTVD